VTSLADRLRGAVWGHLVGDAVGVPYEFRPPSAIGTVVFGATGSHGQPPGTWSDDGALMLATLDSLLSVGLDLEDQARRFLAWERGTAYTPDGDGRFDIGGATQAALRRLAEGTPAIVAGGRDEHDNGNGSLMRILPVALVGRDLPRDELVENAEASSRITHQHRWSQTTCAVYVLVARALLAGAEPEFALRHTLADVRGWWTAGWPSPDRVAALDRLEGWTKRTGSGFVIDTFWSAWDAFAGAASYEETIVRAVAYGDDTDTTACVAGGLAGIRWGIDGIPRAWLDGMRGHDLVDPLVERLAGTAV
jgi:ADP-ribosylglycohydrolase